MTHADNSAAGLAGPSGADSRQEERRRKHTSPSTHSQRLPAYGRRLRDALRAGLRPCKGGGTIVVTTQWDYACAFDPGRLVCPTDTPATSYDFAYLVGCPVVVVVPRHEQVFGESLAAVIRDAGASLVVLSLNPEDDE